MTALVFALAAASLLRASVCAVAVVVERRRLPAIAPGAGPPLSIVVPLDGWDARFLELLDGLAGAARAYGAPVEVIVVVDADHPRHAEIAARPLVRALAPALTLEPGDADKVRRLRCGVREARHALVMLVDSDVIVDDAFLLRRVAAHVADPALRLSFALPAYAQARALGDATLGAFTLFQNLLVFFLGWWLLRKGTSIGPSQLLRNDDGALVSMLDGIRASVADDHALGRAVELRGERVRAVPMEVVVHASDPSVRASARQVVRWMAASKGVGPLLTPLGALWFCASFLLSGAGPVLVVAGLASDARLALCGLALMLLEGAWFALLEALFRRAPPRISRVLLVPAALLATPALAVRGMLAKSVPWRGATIDVDQRGNGTSRARSSS